MSLQSKNPLAVRIYNFLFPKGKLDADRLIHKAKKKEKLDDLGDPRVVQHLKLLCEAINTEANLHPFGVFITKQRLMGVLRNRLRAMEWFKRAPSILEQEIKPPIIITGLQRTGTTFLHRLLAAPNENRALLSWEALNPAPLFHPKDKEKRIKQAITSQKALKYIAPAFFSIHPVEATSPEEDVLLNDMTFLSAVPEATMQVPGFSKWVEKQDHSMAYDWMLKMLKLLQWQSDSASTPVWILKTPQHLEYMDVVVKLFPKATIIHTHRHPKECIPSFASMVYHSRRIFSNEVNPEKVAAHWLQKNAYMMERMLKVRKEATEVKFMDVFYTDLVKDPIEIVKQIHLKADLPWTPEINEQVSRAKLSNKKDKYGKHQYDQADFGLTDTMIANAFDFYLHKFPFHEQAEREQEL